MENFCFFELSYTGNFRSRMQDTWNFHASISLYCDDTTCLLYWPTKCEFKLNFM